ncbi:hypothetical protein XA68_10381 [Ophiocordyceps unilateralis]|uniref:Uncharacterized protein n=1 Tax=Ophiocordyceps unilateralis TaxID=268505 RepID=A0A2A9PIQ9_OPHUN|nr:hypothetical protein XA68_10381 [Ophiocordyceps unilateralis]
MSAFRLLEALREIQVFSLGRLEVIASCVESLKRIVGKKTLIRRRGTARHHRLALGELSQMDGHKALGEGKGATADGVKD